MEEFTHKRKTQTQGRDIRKGGIREMDIHIKDAPFGNEIAASDAHSGPSGCGSWIGVRRAVGP